MCVGGGGVEGGPFLTCVKGGTFTYLCERAPLHICTREAHTIICAMGNICYHRCEWGLFTYLREGGIST